MRAGDLTWCLLAQCLKAAGWNVHQLCWWVAYCEKCLDTFRYYPPLFPSACQIVYWFSLLKSTLRRVWNGLRKIGKSRAYGSALSRILCKKIIRYLVWHNIITHLKIHISLRHTSPPIQKKVKVFFLQYFLLFFLVFFVLFFRICWHEHRAAAISPPSKWNGEELKQKCNYKARIKASQPRRMMINIAIYCLTI